MADNERIAAEVLDAVGGKDNITVVVVDPEIDEV